MFGRLTAVGAAVAGLALVAGPALAVSSTGPSSATFTADKGSTVLTANGQTLTCTSSSVGGPIHASGNPVANITAASWGGCSWGSFPATVAVTSPNWALNVSSGATSALGDHSVLGTLTGINNVHVDINTGLGHCTFDVTGSVGGAFDEWVDKNGDGVMDVGDAQQLTVSNSLLTISNTAGLCLGLVNNNDSATFSGVYNYYPQTAPNASPSDWINILP